MTPPESAQLQRVRNARSGLLMTHPFFGVLSLKLAIREDNTHPTAGINDREMVFNGTFVSNLENVELKGLIVHEVLHLALGHHARMGSRNPKLWNLACDFAINPVLVDDGFTLPQGGAIDPQFKGMSAEAIYDKLREMAQDMAKAMGAGGEAGERWGEFESPGPEGSADANESARQWGENAAEAARAASSAGKLPAHIKRVIDASLSPRADWKNILRRFMTDQVRIQSTWSKPNKRFYPGLYLPGKIKDGLGELVIGVDTSGSIDDRTLAKFAAEISAIAEDVEPACVRVVYCDADVNHVETFEQGEEITLHPHGGGGTRFTPVFDRVAREGWQPSALIYLTDLCCSDYPSEPGYPVLWASYGAGGAVAPMGETVAIDG